MDTTRILVPVDLTDSSVRLVDATARFARAQGLGVELLHVVDPVMLVRPELRMGMAVDSAVTHEALAREEAERKLARLLTRPSLDGVRVQTRVDVGEVAQVLLERARLDRPAFIAMGTHGRTGAARLLLGSVAQKVIAHAACPVVTWRLELLRTGPEALRQRAG